MDMDMDDYENMQVIKIETDNENNSMDNGDKHEIPVADENENNQENADAETELCYVEEPDLSSKELDELLEIKNEAWKEINGIVTEINKKVNDTTLSILLGAEKIKKEAMDCMDELMVENGAFHTECRDAVNDMIGNMEEGDTRCSEMMEYLKQVEDTMKRILE